MAQRLERTNDLAKLYPCFQIIQRHIECLAAGPKHLRRDARPGPVKDLMQFRLSSCNSLIAEGDIRKVHVGVTTTINCCEGFATDAFSIGINDKHSSDVLRFSRNDKMSCRHALEHKRLVTRERISRTGLGRFDLQLIRVVSRPLINGEREDRTPVNDLGEIFLSLGFATANDQDGSTDQPGGKQWRSSQLSAYFLQDNTESQVTET